MKELRIEDLIPEEIKGEFCREHNIEDVDTYDGHVIGVEYETIEEYYGHRLIEPIIKQEYTVQYVKEWVEKFQSSK